MRGTNVATANVCKASAAELLSLITPSTSASGYVSGSGATPYVDKVVYAWNSGSNAVWNFGVYKVALRNFNLPG